MTPDRIERNLRVAGLSCDAVTVKFVLALCEDTARDEREACAKVAKQRRDNWRAEADTYSEANEARFVRNIRAGEAQAIFAAIRARGKE
jgi:hypothetical protein